MNLIEVKSERRRGRWTNAAGSRRLRPAVVVALVGRTLLSIFTVNIEISLIA